jgi:hypothetical protein
MASRNSGNKIMSNVIKSKFVGKNPFKPSFKEVDIASIKITNDQPKKRIARNGKYDSVFKDLEVGKSLSCKSEDCDRVSQALRGYIERNEKPWKVKGTMYYTKTTARIFVLEKQ